MYYERTKDEKRSPEEEWLEKSVFFEADVGSECADIIFNSSVIEEKVWDFFPTLSKSAKRRETIFRVHVFTKSMNDDTIIETFEQVTGNEEASKDAVGKKYVATTNEWYNDIKEYLDSPNH